MTAATEREPKPCFPCDGAGMLEYIVGEHRGGNGVAEPVTEERPCEACDGDGTAPCEHCGDGTGGAWIGGRWVGDEWLCDACAASAEDEA